MSTTIQDTLKCPHCGNMPHNGQCPKIKSIEYYDNGSIKKVEYREDYIEYNKTNQEILDTLMRYK